MTEHRHVDALAEAIRTAAGEMAGVPVVAGTMSAEPRDRWTGAIAVAIDLQSARFSRLDFLFPEPTATALATRILVEAPIEVSADLVRDCLCEFANVVAGQAKSLLAETPLAFTFSLPRVAEAAPMPSSPDCEEPAMVFESEIGAWAARWV